MTRLENMKRPPIEYALIGIGCTISAISLITAISDLGSYAVSILFSLLVLLPFCLPWHRNRYPYVFLLSLVAPISFCWVAVPQFISIYKSMQSGKNGFEGLPSSLFIGFLNMHLLVLGTLLVTAYAALQTIKRLKCQGH